MGHCFSQPATAQSVAPVDSGGRPRVGTPCSTSSSSPVLETTALTAQIISGGELRNEAHEGIATTTTAVCLDKKQPVSFNALSSGQTMLCASEETFETHSANLQCSGSILVAQTCLMDFLGSDTHALCQSTVWATDGMDVGRIMHVEDVGSETFITSNSSPSLATAAGSTSCMADSRLSKNVASAQPNHARPTCSTPSYPCQQHRASAGEQSFACAGIRPLSRYSLLLRHVNPRGTAMACAAVNKLTGAKVVAKVYQLDKLGGIDTTILSRSLQMHATQPHATLCNVVDAFVDVKETKGRPVRVQVIIQERPCSRGGLRAMLASGKTYSEAEAVQSVIVPLLDALLHMHLHGIVHRDIRPENLGFVQGSMKLLDFGIPIAIGPLHHHQHSQARVGSPRSEAWYTAPEQLRDRGQRLSDMCAADMWAVGCIMYELLTGQPAVTSRIELCKQAHAATVPASRAASMPRACASQATSSCAIPTTTVTSCTTSTANTSPQDGVHSSPLSTLSSFSPPASLQLAFPSSMSAAARSAIAGCLVLNPAQRLRTQQLYLHPFIQQHRRSSAPTLTSHDLPPSLLPHSGEPLSLTLVGGNQGQTAAEVQTSAGGAAPTHKSSWLNRGASWSKQPSLPRAVDHPMLWLSSPGIDTPSQDPGTNHSDHGILRVVWSDGDEAVEEGTSAGGSLGGQGGAGDGARGEGGADGGDAGSGLCGKSCPDQPFSFGHTWGSPHGSSSAGSGANTPSVSTYMKSAPSPFSSSTCPDSSGGDARALLHLDGSAPASAFPQTFSHSQRPKADKSRACAPSSGRSDEGVRSRSLSASQVGELRTRLPPGMMQKPLQAVASEGARLCGSEAADPHGPPVCGETAEWLNMGSVNASSVGKLSANMLKEAALGAHVCVRAVRSTTDAPQSLPASARAAPIPIPPTPFSFPAHLPLRCCETRSAPSMMVWGMKRPLPSSPLQASVMPEEEEEEEGSELSTAPGSSVSVAMECDLSSEHHPV